MEQYSYDMFQYCDGFFALFNLCVKYYPVFMLQAPLNGFIPSFQYVSVWLITTFFFHLHGKHYFETTAKIIFIVINYKPATLWDDWSMCCICKGVYIEGQYPKS